MTVPVLKLVRIDEYLVELADRGPNVDLVVRLALRRPAQRGTSGAYDLYVTSSYIRDIGPPEDPFRTLVVVAFDYFVGSLTNTEHNDTPTKLAGEQVFNRIKDTVLKLNLSIAKGYYAGANQ